MTNDIKTGFLIYDTEIDDPSPYWDGVGWQSSIQSCGDPFESVKAARGDIDKLLAYRVGLIVIDLTGKQVWPEVATATDSTEVKSLRKQVADLTAEIDRLKANRRERIATAALQGLLAGVGGKRLFAHDTNDADRYADYLIVKLDGKED